MKTRFDPLPCFSLGALGLGHPSALSRSIQMMRKIEILVIEDNSADRLWLEFVLEQLEQEYRLSCATDGEQAVDFLLKRGAYAHAPTPDMIFLDVHLPVLDGIEILREIPNARELPICVLTSSGGERDQFKREFGIQHANYLLKPVSYNSLLDSPCCCDHLKLQPSVNRTS